MPRNTLNNFHKFNYISMEIVPFKTKINTLYKSISKTAGCPKFHSTNVWGDVTQTLR